MRNILSAFIALALLASICALSEAAASGQVTYGVLLADLLAAYESPAGDSLSRIDADAEALDDGLARAIAEHWKKVYLDPDYRLYLYGTDEPAELGISGRHAFVVLGFELQDGEMADELKGRCDAAAEAAKAFPGSILVCSGGATGENNPEGHTEAGLMRDYLVTRHGIDIGRIFTDERAMTTAENAVNTFALLRDQGIETMTLVTSAYHQRWAQVLYNALAEQYREEFGYSAAIVGNFCYDVEPSREAYRQDARIAVIQLGKILGLPQEEMDLLPGIMGGPRKKAN